MTQMKLTEKNILFVKELTKDGMPYSWHVSMKSHQLFDARSYINYGQDGRTVCEEYPKEWLPKAVQKFIEKRSREEIRSTECKAFGENGLFVHYIYK